MSDMDIVGVGEEEDDLLNDRSPITQPYNNKSGELIVFQISSQSSKFNQLN